MGTFRVVGVRLVTVLAFAPALVLAACAQTAQSTRSEPEKPAAAQEKPQGQQQQQADTQKPPAPKPLFATSPDGTRIAYEVTGEGPALMLVHGGGQTRRTWHQIGYVDRLAKQFRVITVDLRGAGDSDKPVAAGAYAVDKMTADLLAVADAAGAKRFHVWGFGHGGTIARYLAASHADRVASAVLVGMTMGPAVTGVLKDAITAMQAKWQPIIDKHLAGTLKVEELSSSDRAAWENDVAVNTLMLTALLEYPPLEPSEIKAPTLWIVGGDDSAAENAKGYEGKLEGASVTLKLIPSLNYSDSFVKFEQMLEEVEPFLKKHAAITTTL